MNNYCLSFMIGTWRCSYSLQMLEQQLNETRTRKQMEISEIDGRLTEKYEAKMQQSLAVSIFVNFLSCKSWSEWKSLRG